MKKLILTISILTLTACASVKGVVRDKDTGTPVPSANVTVNRSSTITDAYGHYRLTGSFVPGDTVMVNAPGYNIYTRSITTFEEIADIELTSKQQ